MTSKQSISDLAQHALFDALIACNRGPYWSLSCDSRHMGVTPQTLVGSPSSLLVTPVVDHASLRRNLSAEISPKKKGHRISIHFEKSIFSQHSVTGSSADKILL